MQPKIGFLGLGIMGTAMARNILKAGFPLLVYNRTPAKAKDLVAAGATLAPSPLSLNRRCRRHHRHGDRARGPG